MPLLRWFAVHFPRYTYAIILLGFLYDDTRYWLHERIGRLARKKAQKKIKVKMCRSTDWHPIVHDWTKRRGDA